MQRRFLIGVASCAALAAAALVAGMVSGASSASLANAPWNYDLIDPVQDVGYHISMVPDGAGGAVISFNLDNSDAVVAEHWQPGSSPTLLLNGSGDYTYNSVAVFSQGDVHTVTMVFYLNATDDLYYMTRAFGADWTPAGDTDLGVVSYGDMFSHSIYPSVQYDSNGVAHLAYYRNLTLSTSDSLHYAYWDGDSWVDETVASGDGVGRYASLAIDGNNHPHIAYRDGGNGYPLVASYNGSSWTVRNVRQTSLSTGSYVSLAVGDSSTDLHIAHYNVTSDTLDYAHYVGSGGNCGYSTSAFVYRWECYDIEPVGIYSGEVVRPIDIALDGDSSPVIAYQNANSAERVVRIARPNEAYGIQIGNCGPEVFFNTWYCDTVDPGGSSVSGTGNAVALDVNSAGAATVLYRRTLDLGSDDNLKIAYQRTELFLPLILKN